MSLAGGQCRGLFITGTDTGVGKTAVGSALVRWAREQGRNVGAYKPAASGCEFDAQGNAAWEDVEAYFHALGQSYPRDRICPQQFRAALAPPVAARLQDEAVDDRLLVEGAQWWTMQVDHLVVEGAGGLLSPLSQTQSNADLAVKLGWPALIVARAGLGTINHILLTAEAAVRRGLSLRGIVLNSSSAADDPLTIRTNCEELGRWIRTPVLSVLPYSPDCDLLHHPAFLRMALTLWNDA